MSPVTVPGRLRPLAATRVLVLACLATTCTWLVLASAFTEHSLHIRLMPLCSAVTLVVSLYQARQGRAPWLALAAGILGTYDAATACLLFYYELAVLLPPYYVLSLSLTALCHQAVLVLHVLLVLVALPATRTVPATSWSCGRGPRPSVFSSSGRSWPVRSPSGRTTPATAACPLTASSP